MAQLHSCWIIYIQKHKHNLNKKPELWYDVCDVNKWTLVQLVSSCFQQNFCSYISAQQEELSPFGLSWMMISNKWTHHHNVLFLVLVMMNKIRFLSLWALILMLFADSARHTIKRPLFMRMMMLILIKIRFNLCLSSSTKKVV